MSTGARFRPKLVISDVDGTLVDKQKQLHQATVEAVGRLRAAGIAFTIISARPMSGMVPLIDRLNLDGPMGAFNGGTIFRRDHRIVEKHRVPAEVIDGILALAVDAPVDTWVFADDRWHASTAIGTHVEHERIASAQQPDVVRDFTRFRDRVDKLTLVSDDRDLLKRLHGKALARYGDQATIAQSQTYYLDVTAAAANKGDGVAALAAAFGVDLSDVAVLGDMPNDLPMFTRAGFAIAMGQAPDEVKVAADAVSTSNDQDGVAHAIDTVLLG